MSGWHSCGTPANQRKRSHSVRIYMNKPVMRACLHVDINLLTRFTDLSIMQLKFDEAKKKCERLGLDRKTNSAHKQHLLLHASFILKFLPFSSEERQKS